MIASQTEISRLQKVSRGMLRVEIRLRWVSYEPADLVNAIPFELLLCQTS